MNADAQAIVFVLMLPFFAAFSAHLWSAHCEASDARVSRSSRARARIWGGE